MCVTGVDTEYAFRQGKRIMLLQMEANCQPDGWLRHLCGNSVSFNFSDRDEANFVQEWLKLYAQLKELELRGCDKIIRHNRPITEIQTTYLTH